MCRMTWVFTAKIQCYITSPWCYSKGTVLHHIVWVLQPRYSVTSYGLNVPPTLQCYITWAACYYVWVLQKTEGVTSRVSVLSLNEVSYNYAATHMLWLSHETVTVHTKSDLTEMLWSICWRLPSTLWRSDGCVVLLLTNCYCGNNGQSINR